MEKDLERYLKREIEKIGGLIVKFIAPGTNGVPDRIVLFNAKTYFVEMKAPDGKLSPIQKETHRRFSNRKVKIYVLWNREEIDRFVRKVASGAI